MAVTLFFLLFNNIPPFLLINARCRIILEQNTYNQCPVCSYPLTVQSAVCPRCGNDILEDITSLDEQSQEIHRQHIEEKKAEWYTRCLTEKLNCSPNHPAGPPVEQPPKDNGRHLYCQSDEIEYLRTISRAELLRESSARKKWWQTMTDEWKEIIKTTLKVVREPSDQELLDFLETTHLRCDNRRIHDLLPVRMLEKLQQLRCDESPVSDLEPLAHLEKLQRLYAFDCDFSSLDPLRNLTSLKLLWISSTQITTLEPVSKLSNLEELYCSETPINDLSPLKKLFKLEKLSCYKTGISSLAPLRHLENLIELGINSSYVTDLSPLSGLSNLEYLRCNKTAIENIEPLRSLAGLRELSLANTHVMTIEALEELTYLEELDISNTLVSSIDPLMQLQNLEKIELSPGNIPRDELERFIELHPECEVILRK
ncbi:Leucine-rich repeat [Chlorobium ferrooxidans DSM 13031]|uniref:Leucine-rich repeat n=1 Tax=Chlorobium ferrooxidans DSM 13031 TaxID=377431 RepID=Q0YT58_9CHLB|nr:Leucine-rich repeat [Chlorobium ferrooxidans DSM 13031]